MIVPTNTTELAEQEQRDINTFSGERVSVQMNRYTTHNLALEVGVEYTLSWGRERRDVVRRVPEAAEDADVDAAVTNAMRLAADGDTASAIAALEHRTSVEPRDAYAWRELALLKANRGEIDPTARPEALATLERALNMNPGDTELLRAYGRLRGLTERAGTTPDAVAVAPVEMSSISAVAQPDGGIRAAWATRGLTPASDGRYRYEAAIEVFDTNGTPVPLRPGLAPLHSGENESLLMLGDAESLPMSLSVDFFLAEPEPGIYTVRIRMTDLETSARQEATQGFEIP
jgi:tetratricopeptide (TPR) repeat protein